LSLAQVLKNAIEKRWYADSPGMLNVLLPFEVLFRWAASRRRAQATRQNTVEAAPVVVIGNLSVGGTGKTPVIVALVTLLEKQNLNVAVVSRGYGRSSTELHHLNAESTAAEAGDEPIEIFQRCACDVVVHEKRNLAVDYVQQKLKPDVILSDDGLQHYAMPRDVEIVVVSRSLGFGNQHCLPVGPLREPLSRLNSVDFVLINNASNTSTAREHPSLASVDQNLSHMFSVQPVAWVNVHSGQRQTLEFKPGKNVCAYAGIGQPSKFFSELEKLGLATTQFAKDDHASYQLADFDSTKFDAYVMTAKDAVKCRGLAPENTWYLEVEAGLPSLFTAQLLRKLA